MIKYFIIYLVSTLSAKEFCETIPGTLRIVKTNGCGSSILCMGYAKCVNGKETGIGKIFCKANSDGSCPDAQACFESTFTNHDINISVQPQGKIGGVYQYCNSKEKFSKSNNPTDVVYSRICNVVSGDYSQKKKDDMVNNMTATLGKERIK